MLSRLENNRSTSDLLMKLCDELFSGSMTFWMKFLEKRTTDEREQKDARLLGHPTGRRSSAR